MSKLNEWKLTDAQLDVIRRVSLGLSTFGELRAIADAGGISALRAVVAWLRTDSSLWDLNGLQIVAKLESMLNEERRRG